MIAMNDFKRDDEELVRQELSAVERVLRSGWWILGAEVGAFEAEWADWCGAKHAAGLANGMDALEIGLRALGIGPGDEVVTTPMTAFATVLSIFRTGASPVLADIDPDTGILSTESVKRCLSKATRAVMVVHLYGQAGPVEELAGICAKAGIHLVEDCAQAHGAKASGKPCGTWGAFAGWSFYPTKNLGTAGDGGALTTESAALDEKVRRIRNYGQSVRYQHPEIGMNSRLDELHAAILRERLKRLEPWTARRRAIAHSYADKIRHPKVRVLPLPADPARHVHHLFVVVSPVREALQAHLKASGVDSLFHYPIPAHHQPPCAGVRVDPKGLGAAEEHARTCLSLPIHPQMSDAEVAKVVEAVNTFKG